MNVLSLFDGISCAMMALQRANIPVKKYYASEIDKFAISVSKKNHPTIEHIGNVKDIKALADIDILIGGSPCQDLSIAKKDRKGLEGNRSSLFWEYVRLLRECNPKYFIFENVASMPSKDKDIITQALGVEPILLNASLVSAQSRKRLFWTNILVEQPVDRGIKLKDILDNTNPTLKVSIGRDIGRRINKEGVREDYNKDIPITRRIELRDDEKCGTLTSATKDNLVVLENKEIRKLTPVECERLQGLPDNYTSCISNTQRYKCLGNAFNVDIVAHILRSV
jgi:site-specific DNA-cytosine methylase